MATRKMPVKNPSSMSNQWTKENGEQGILLDPLNAVQTGFRLTTGQQRDTHSRAEMMAFLQDQVLQLQTDCKAFVDGVDERWLEMVADKNAMIAETHRFLKNMEK